MVIGLASDSAILRRASNELGELRRLRGIDGWTDGLVARGLAPLRIVAAYAVAHPVTQSRGDGARASDGQLVVPGRWPGQRTVLVSSSMTSVTLEAEGRRIEAHGLDSALNRFAVRAYGRDGRLVDDTDLDEALDAGLRTLARLRREHGWLATKLRAIASPFLRLKARLKPGTTDGLS
jgi:hypothetical protein